MKPLRTSMCLSHLLATTLVAVASVADAAGWPDEHRSGAFVYHADFQMRNFHPLLESVSQLQHDVTAQLGLTGSNEPVHVFLFHRQSAYRAYVRRYFPNAPPRPALFVKQRGPGMVFARVGPNLAVDLRHETTHAVLHRMLPMVPLWLDEGLAEYFEAEREKRASGNPHLNSIRSRARWGRVPRIEALERLGDLADMKAEHYRDAWAWVHFMLHGPPEAKQTLVSYLNDVAAHVPPGDLSKRLRRSVPGLDRAYLAHFRGFTERGPQQASKSQASLLRLDSLPDR